MKIIGICGSHRKGNTEWMLEQVMVEAACRGAQTETLLLRRLDVRMCLGCLMCEVGGVKRPGICKIKDDMNAIYPRLLDADALVLATPGYFEMMSGLLKNFIDRTCAIWPRMSGKRIAGIAVAEEGLGQTVSNLKTYARLCNMEWVGSVSVLAKNPGDASKIAGLDKRLIRLAGKLTAGV
uniref:Flavodoxin family protein n=1 Tax=uncultured Dehalococcoidia bacterium TaxID=498747 RepID=A0A871Y6V9_9CHLR|nr:Flavodoxin family protein [uncultured Dehalococcoidia bacterium]